MRPLDLKVAIQNSYEASRSEAVRLDKPVAASHMANEDAKRDQVHRDQSVTPPPETRFDDDIFHREKEHEPDYTEGSGGKKQSPERQARPKTESKQGETPETGDGEKPADSASDGHISTYA